MNNIDLHKISIDEFKIQASILLKNLNSNHTSDAEALLKQLPEFKNSDLKTIQENAQRKHALKAIALQNGFESWNDLKANCEQVIANTFVKAYVGGHLNKWFAHYEEAKSEHNRNGGYLLPYKHQFFICDADYIVMLGLDPNDQDWVLIGFDWAKPTNIKAWQRLFHKWLTR